MGQTEHDDQGPAEELQRGPGADGELHDAAKGAEQGAERSVRDELPGEEPADRGDVVAELLPPSDGRCHLADAMATLGDRDGGGRGGGALAGEQAGE